LHKSVKRSVDWESVERVWSSDAQDDTGQTNYTILMPKKLICLNEIFLIKSKTFNVNYHSELNLKPWWATFPPGIIQIYYYYLLNFLIRL